jgi:hypothetical protein
MHPYDWIILGLSLDVAGGLTLAKGFMLKRMDDIMRESRTHFGRNSFLVKAGLMQKAEATVGGTLLAAGFGAQLVGTFVGGPAANELGHRWARERFRAFFFRGYTATAPALAGDDWDGLAWLYDTVRQKGETDDALRERLEELRRSLGPRYTLTP